MIDGLKMANIENTDKNAKLAPLPLAGAGGGQFAHVSAKKDIISSEE